MHCDFINSTKHTNINLITLSSTGLGTAIEIWGMVRLHVVQGHCLGRGTDTTEKHSITG